MSGPREPLRITDVFTYFYQSRVDPPSQDMDVPTLHLPDDDDTTPQISIRRSAGAPISDINDNAQRAHGGSTSNLSSQ